MRTNVQNVNGISTGRTNLKNTIANESHANLDWPTCRMQGIKSKSALSLAKKFHGADQSKLRLSPSKGGLYLHLKEKLHSFERRLKIHRPSAGYAVSLDFDNLRMNFD